MLSVTQSPTAILGSLWTRQNDTNTWFCLGLPRIEGFPVVRLRMAFFSLHTRPSIQYLFFPFVLRVPHRCAIHSSFQKMGTQWEVTPDPCTMHVHPSRLRCHLVWRLRLAQWPPSVPPSVSVEAGFEFAKTAVSSAPDQAPRPERLQCPGEKPIPESQAAIHPSGG